VRSSQHRQLGTQLGECERHVRRLGRLLLALALARRGQAVRARHPVTVVHFEGAVLVATAGAHQLGGATGQELALLAAPQHGEDGVGTLQPLHTRLEHIAIDRLETRQL
jgi:hypothetical protein